MTERNFKDEKSMYKTIGYLVATLAIYLFGVWCGIESVTCTETFKMIQR